MIDEYKDTEDTTEIVPYLEAKIPKGTDNFYCTTVKLSGDREITVGYGATDGARRFDIRRPTEDGKTSQLKFACSKEAALAILYLLDKSFEHEAERLGLGNPEEAAAAAINIVNEELVKILRHTLEDSKQRESLEAPEDAEVKALCERIGYGAVMDSAARQCRRKNDSGAFVVGPCIGTLTKYLEGDNRGRAIV